MTTTARMMRRMNEAVSVAEDYAEFDFDALDADVLDHVEFVTRFALNRAERREVLAAYDQAAREALHA